MKIDNFALTMFQACPAKYKLRMVDGYTTRRKSAALGFGGAFHAGLAEWYRSGERLKMIQAVQEAWPHSHPIDDFRTLQKCVDTLLAYTKTYPAENFQVVQGPNGPLVEVSFTLDTGLFLRCQTCLELDKSTAYMPHCSYCGQEKERLEYGGIFDTLVEFSGSVYVLEHKTTSQLGAYYFNQFRPNNQVSGYTWAGSLLSGKRVGGAIINAIGVYKASSPKFEREVTIRSEEEIAEWLVSVHATCEAIKQCERTGIWPLHTVACTMYGLCEFHQVHVLASETQRQALLEQEYVKSTWDYEARDD